jgi:hypothetical protein
VADVQVLARPNVDDTVRAVVRALLAYRGMKPEQVAADIGVSRGGFYKKLNSTGVAYPFKAVEIYAMSKLFGVPISIFFEGLDQFGDPHRPDSDQPLASPRHHLASWPRCPDRHLTLVLPFPDRRLVGQSASAA